MLRSLKLILAMVLFINLGCSTDSPGDSTPSNPTENPSSSENPSNPPLTGTSVKTSEIINIEVNTNLNSDEYQGTFGSRDISLVKVDENHLMVMVPSDMEEGISTLKVSGLGIEKHYDVSELKLNGTATETFNNLFSNVTAEINSFDSSSDSQYVSDYWSQVKASFDNASEEDQIKATLFYQANKQMIDDFLRDDYIRQSESDLSILSKHKLAVLAFGTGVTVAILSPDPITKALAAGVAIIAWKKAKGYLSYLADKKLKKINFIIDDLESELSRQQVQRLKFTHDVSQTLSLKVKQRTISSEDQSDANSNLGLFFEGFNLFNEVVRKLNNVIEYVNENLFLSSIETVDDASLRDDSPSSTSMSSEIYEKMEFSVGSDKLEITEISYQNGLKLKLKIKDVENLSQDYIDSQLNYSFSDDFNDIDGRFQIRVEKMEEFQLKGEWKLIWYFDEERTQKSQTDLIDFQNGSPDVGIPIWKYSHQNDIYTYHSDESPMTWTQDFESPYLYLESNYNGLILQFEYNPETPETIKGWIPGQEEGKRLELLKN